MTTRSRSDILQVKYLSECFTPDYSEGVLYWNVRPIYHFKNERAWKIWNTRYSGKKAGAFIRKGCAEYARVTIDNQYFYVHHILWILFYGWYSLDYEVDHIDRNTKNNSIRNLRLATRKEQVWNTGSRSGQPKGVSWDSSRNKWLMQFRVEGEKFNARFTNKQTASLIYDILSYSYHKKYHFGGECVGGEILYEEIQPSLRKKLDSVDEETKQKYGAFFNRLKDSRRSSRKTKYLLGVSYNKTKNKFIAYKTNDFGKVVGNPTIGQYSCLFEACCARISWENSMKERHEESNHS